MQFNLVCSRGEFVDSGGEGCLEEGSIKDETIFFALFSNKVLWCEIKIREEALYPVWKHRHIVVSFIFFNVVSTLVVFWRWMGSCYRRGIFCAVLL